MHTLLLYIRPWEFSPTVFLVCLGSVVLYIRGLRALAHAGRGVGLARPLAFFLGLLLMYAVLQTYYDYLSQHMFWIHRLQHLVLHHLAPFLVVLSLPGEVLAAGLPVTWRARLAHAGAGQRWLWRSLHLLQGPVIAPLLFVGLIFFWLTPSIHFTAMLNADRYRLMNWSMAVDGLLFWWVILTPRTLPGGHVMGYAMRILVLVAVTVPQILLGAHITLHPTLLYDVYAICGRAWAISPLEDQQFGGLITWIPPAMMAGIALLLVLRLLLQEIRTNEQRAGTRPAPLAPSHLPTK